MTATPESPGLTAHGLVRRFGGIAAVDGVDLTVPPGRITALVGPNGAGKSTLFDCLSGVARPDAGRVLLAGRDVTRLPDHARARLGLARTFQQIAVFPGLTVGENARLGAEQGSGGTVRGLLGLPAPGAPAAREATDRALRLFGLDAVRDWPADRLPTGALRLLELARAFASSPTCCCWTSRPPVWTWHRPPVWARCCGRSRPRGSRCCWWSMMSSWWHGSPTRSA
ncbi:ABC transporter family protein [Streptomyces sp. TLI_235]|nr:ABC transporter family protein [Streptomyces sp. TLI_235]